MLWQLRDRQNFLKDVKLGIRNIKWGGVVKKCRTFRMSLNVSAYQLKTDGYLYRSVYMNNTVNTNQKSTMDIQKIKRKEYKQNTKGIHWTTREEERKRQEQRRTVKKKNQKTINKMAISTSLSIIEYKWTKCPNQKTQGSWMDKKQESSLCCLQETQLKYKNRHRLKVKGWKSYSMQWEQRKAMHPYSYQAKWTLKQRL